MKIVFGKREGQNSAFRLEEKQMKRVLVLTVAIATIALTACGPATPTPTPIPIVPPLPTTQPIAAAIGGFNNTVAPVNDVGDKTININIVVLHGGSAAQRGLNWQVWVARITKPTEPDQYGDVIEVGGWELVGEGTDNRVLSTPANADQDTIILASWEWDNNSRADERTYRFYPDVGGRITVYVFIPLDDNLDWSWV
jgi:hypothetical protein